MLLIWAVPLQTDPDVRRVIRVIDGDTIHVTKGLDEIEKVRLIGIDSPELQAGDDKGPQPYATEASNYLRKLVLNKRVRMHHDVEKYDKYGRTLAYIYLEDGTFVNAKMMEAGLARTMTIPPNVKHSWELADLQKKARKAKVGMWSE